MSSVYLNQIFDSSAYSAHAPLPSMPRYYQTSSGSAQIIVGKNAKDNDAITFQSRGVRDLWFHAKDVQGAHVILCPISNEIVLTPDDIQEAANIAAVNSKGKCRVKVEYCSVWDVIKRRGMAPGQVAIMNCSELDTFSL
jgi:predicted ribosome quality control (RQC) complex YloA/Tae2 family protein